MKDTKKLLNKLATCSLLAGTIVTGMAQPSEAAVASNYSYLGTGGEVRAQVLRSSATPFSMEIKGEEGKCGEGKCGEGKCGEGKCGEGKCGDDKKEPAPE